MPVRAQRRHFELHLTARSGNFDNYSTLAVNHSLLLLNLDTYQYNIIISLHSEGQEIVPSKEIVMFKLSQPSSSRTYRRLSSSLPRRCISSYSTKSEQPKHKHDNLPLSTSGPINCALSGTSLLNTPYLNKGSAFPPDERRKFNLTGLLPQGVQTLDQQCKRAYEQYSSQPDDLSKNTFLTSLKDQNEVLYYKVGLTVLTSIP